MRVLKNWTAAQWYSLVIGLFLLIRGASTFLAGASFTLPGDGWRAAVQLLVAVVLLACLSSRTPAFGAVIGVGVLYAIETAIGNTNGHDILGIIPVDMRDKIVHPTLALLALVAIIVSIRRRRAN